MNNYYIQVDNSLVVELVQSENIGKSVIRAGQIAKEKECKRVYITLNNDIVATICGKTRKVTFEVEDNECSWKDGQCNVARF